VADLGIPMLRSEETNMRIEYKPASLFEPLTEPSANTSLNRLYEHIARQQREEESARAAILLSEMEAMRHPWSITESYRLMGFLLGALPPAAIFWKLFGYAVFTESFIQGNPISITIFVLMNLACAAAGYKVAGIFGRSFGEPQFVASILSYPVHPPGPSSWPGFLFWLPILATIWGLATGAAGGIFGFGFGALVGPLFAIPVAIVGFTVFGVLHRLLARGGMIEARLLLPIAFGVTFTITALIVGVPYAGWR
jgi:hypothetical protein